MEQLSDHTLMLKVKEGDLDRLSLLFQRYNRQLFGFLYHMTADAATSEDLVQNVFYRMLKYRHTYTGKGEFRAWMYQLARNAMADHYRKHKREDETLQHWEPEGEGEGPAAEMQLQLLQQAMARLSPDKREVLLLSRYEGLKYAQIAELLHCSEGAVKVKVHRAMEELKKKFTELEKQNYEMR